uniref:Retrovirus-related Pol polyprotein from transposon TNT 1-94 n=1 Tax=Tanacetum cinerariifolium TaxID=118510 RepID=A0A6L2L2Z0_TANCI|nr:hypothetical protein [Tanacetum cinerariifolium]
MDKNAQDFLKLVEEKFRYADKVLAGTLMAQLTPMKFDGSKSMQQHVLDMTNTAARLKTLESLFTVEHNVGMRRSKVNESSAFLWHIRLGHISKERLQRLVNNEILQNLDFTDFGLCVECIIEKSKGYRFYCPTHSSRIVETCNAKFLENGEVSGSVENQVLDINEIKDDDLSPMNVHKSTTRPDVFKTERDSKGNVKRYKARIVAKGYTQNNGVDYNETFSLVSKKDSLRVILALAAHYDLEPHQMDVKTAFLNGNIEEEVYMEQPEGFFIDGLGVVYTISKPLKMYYDNTATIFLYKNDKYSKGAKHMDIKFFIVKEEIQKQRVYLEHISTDLMIVDPLTKGLPLKEFTQHVPRNWGVFVIVIMLDILLESCKNPFSI